MATHRRRDGRTLGLLGLAVTLIFGRKPRTRVGITTPGRRAFQSHVAYLREILEGDGGNP